MRARADIKELLTPGDCFPAPTKPLHTAGFPTRLTTFFFTSGAVDCLPPEREGDRRFMAVKAPKRRAHTECPIQMEGPYRTRSKLHPVRPLGSTLLLLLVAAVMRGG